MKALVAVLGQTVKAELEFAVVEKRFEEKGFVFASQGDGEPDIFMHIGQSRKVCAGVDEDFRNVVLTSHQLDFLPRIGECVMFKRKGTSGKDATTGEVWCRVEDFARSAMIVAENKRKAAREMKNQRPQPVRQQDTTAAPQSEPAPATNAKTEASQAVSPPNHAPHGKNGKHGHRKGGDIEKRQFEDGKPSKNNKGHSRHNERVRSDREISADPGLQEIERRIDQALHIGQPTAPTATIGDILEAKGTTPKVNPIDAKVADEKAHKAQTPETVSV